MKGVKVAVFANTVNAPTPFYKVSVKRTYKENGKFKDVSSFTRDDLPVIRHLLEKAWLTIFELEKKDRSDNGDGEENES